MKKIIVWLFFMLLGLPTQAQTQEYSYAETPAYDYEYEQSDEALRQMRGVMLNSGDQREARNLMIVAEVASYKLGDEKLAKQFAELENNREYHKKLQKIMSQLDNKKMRNRKNKEVIRILNDAGNKLYNLLAN